MKICLCPSSIAWIRRHLKKSARSQFTRLIKAGGIKKITKRRRTPAQIRATKKLVAFNRRRRKR